MMYTAATAAAVDYQFRKYMARKDSLDARIRKRIAEIQSAYYQIKESPAETEIAGSGEGSSTPDDSESPNEKPNTRENPPRAGPQPEYRRSF